MIDLTIHFPESMRYSTVFKIIDIFSKYLTFINCSKTNIVLKLANIFYDHIVVSLMYPLRLLVIDIIGLCLTSSSH